MSFKNLKATNEKANIKDPKFPDNPMKIVEVDVYEIEIVKTIKINKVVLEEKKASLEVELAEVNDLLSQINS